MLQIVETRHHVGHLHTRIVDIILNFHAPAAGPQHPHERIAQHGVAQMPDVRGFVGIDIGVLDNDLAAGWRPVFRSLQHCIAISAAIEPDIDVAVPRHLHRRDAFDGPEVGNHLRRDRLGGLLQLPCQMERHGNRQFAE